MLKAAKRAGVGPDTPGVIDAGFSGGIGRGMVKTYIAPFASFKIGETEEIKNTRLRMGDIDFDTIDMLIGADFFLSHRIFVANSQHRLYLTFNGGHVFNLDNSDSGGQASAPDASAGAQPADAAALFRRGSAFAGRRDFAHALEDLTRACELNPNEPEYFHQRGLVYLQNNQTDLAMADLDRALALNADYLAARVSRAELRLHLKDIAGAASDLDAADGVAPKQADVRYFMSGAIWIRRSTGTGSSAIRSVASES